MGTRNRDRKTTWRRDFPRLRRHSCTEPRPTCRTWRAASGDCTYIMLGSRVKFRNETLLLFESFRNIICYRSFSAATYGQYLSQIRRLATANRSHVSIRVTKNFGQGRVRGRPYKTVPHIQFDRHTKLTCCFSCCVHACRRSQNFGDAGLRNSLIWWAYD